MRLLPWLKVSLIPWAAATAASVVFGLLEASEGEAFGSARYFLIVSLALLLILQASLVYLSTLPLAISFGSTRREALIGVLLFRSVAAALCAATAAVLNHLEGEAAMLPTATMLPLAFGLDLLAGSLGGLMGKACLRWGTNLAHGIFSAIVAVVMVVFATMFMSIRQPGSFFERFPIEYAVLAAGIASVIFMFPLDKKTVYGYTVKI